MRRAACAGVNPALFDSISVTDHLSARRTCDYCPMSQACLRLALKISAEQGERGGAGENTRGPDGTWGGVLWASGQIQTVVPETAQQTVRRFLGEKAA